jgi:hypothetical protein
MSTISGPAAPSKIRPAADTLFALLAGPIAWAAHLAFVYFVQSMLCAHGLAAAAVAGIPIVPAAVGMATAVFLLVAAGAALFEGDRSREDEGAGSDRGFLRRTRLWLALLSALGIAWAGVSAFALPACATLR